MGEHGKPGENGDSSFYAIGSLTREISGVRREITDLRSEVHSGFRQLGVRLNQKVKKTEQRVEQLEEEFEDTKTRDLRLYKRRYNWWKNSAISGLGLVSTGILTALILHYVFHVSP